MKIQLQGYSKSSYSSRYDCKEYITIANFDDESSLLEASTSLPVMINTDELIRAINALKGIQK